MDRDKFQFPARDRYPILHVAYFLPPDSPAISGKQQPVHVERISDIRSCAFGGILTSVNWNEYLDNQTHWATLRRALAETKRQGMRAWIWDERGRPSGKAAGKVVAQYPEGQARGLVYVGVRVEGARPLSISLPPGKLVYARALPFDGDHISLDQTVGLENSVCAGVLSADLPRGKWLVVAFVERLLHAGTFAQDRQSGDEPYINILDRHAGELFRDLNYQAYQTHVGDYFGNILVGFQTEEVMLITTAFPIKTNFVPKTPPAGGKQWQEASPNESGFPPYPIIPWYHKLPEIFAAQYEYDLIEHLPALFNSIGSKTTKVRCDFYRLIGELCDQAFFRPLAEWCHAKGVQFKAHPLGEESLVAHTAFSGSLFPFFASADVPGADLLSGTLATFKSRDQCLPAPKMVSSIAHTQGRTQVMCDFADSYQYNAGVRVSTEELRGCIGWMHALGINQMVSLCDWNSRSVTEWQHLNTYAARLGATLSGGAHVADLAVLYPITTVWAHYVPSTQFMMLPPIGSLDRPKIWSETYAPDASAWEIPFRDLVWTLLEHQRDLDIVDDAALLKANPRNGLLELGNETYRVLILPPMDVVDHASFECARNFAQAGGMLIAFHPLPHQSAQNGSDAEFRNEIRALFGSAIPAAGKFEMRNIGKGKAVLIADNGGLLRALDTFIVPDIHLAPATTAVFGLHRRKEDHDIYFLTNNTPERIEFSLVVRAQGHVEIWNPHDGMIMPCASEPTAKGTRICLDIAGYAGKFVFVSQG